MVRNTKLCLPNHIPVRDADEFKCHFWQFKADWSEIHFLSKLSLHFYVFVFTLAKNMLPGLQVRRSAWQQILMKILSLREREVLKQLKRS